MLDGTTPGGLILWNPEIVRDWIGRNEAYHRLRARANAGQPALTVQAYADFLRTLRLRKLPNAIIDGVILEIKKQFIIFDLTVERAECFGLAAIDCDRTTQDPTVRGEAWFAWQVALA